jgi:hypothetical protein
MALPPDAELTRHSRAEPNREVQVVRDLPDAYLGWTIIVAQNAGPIGSLFASRWGFSTCERVLSTARSVP